jgi:hypothetical protein
VKGIRFKLERAIVGSLTDVAYVSATDDPFEAVAQAVLADIATSLEVTVSGVTMFLAAWRDPDHWSDDWAKKLGIDYEDVGNAVWALLEQAMEEK